MKSKAFTQSGLHALVWQEGKWFVSKSLEIEVASQGKTKAEALKNLGEAIDLYFEDEKLIPPAPLANPEIHVVQLG